MTEASRETVKLSPLQILKEKRRCAAMRENLRRRKTHTQAKEGIERNPKEEEHPVPVEETLHSPLSPLSQGEVPS